MVNVARFLGGTNAAVCERARRIFDYAG
jgi:hypothetical protein